MPGKTGEKINLITSKVSNPLRIKLETQKILGFTESIILGPLLFKYEIGHNLEIGFEQFSAFFYPQPDWT